ncbi:MAG TPA: NADH-quinone oxidoreductase subunit C [Acidimicrobiia bacterium]|nr:NADH-quinone oxidoreductase subunit C [Acidimicrobiia bacterium]
MSSSPSETATHPLQEFADHVAEAVGGRAEIQFDTIKVSVPNESWVDAHATARDDLDLVFFSWLSAIDWSNQVEAGDPLDEEVEERIELMSALSDLAEGKLVVFSTDLSSQNPTIPTLVTTFAGANWHEREAHEMFGIDFQGHPNLIHLYLPDSFQGNPLRKTFPLLSREVKPWPGKVDVESMPEDPSPDQPSTENPEA